MITIIVYMLIAILGGAGICLWNYIKKLKYIKQNIIDYWGKEIEEKCTEENMKDISSYFRNKKEDGSFSIDDITWNDVSMDEIFGRMNNTKSSAGEEILYNTLRNPLHNEKELKERDEIITYFENNDKERIDMQFTIAKLGKCRKSCVSNYFYAEENVDSNKLIYYRFLSVLPLAAIGLCFLNKSAVLIVIIPFIINMYLHYKLQQENEYKFEAFMYIISLVKCADKISKFDIEELQEQFRKFRPFINNVKDIKNYYFSSVNSFNVNNPLIILDSIKVSLLIDVINFEKMRRMLVTNKEDFENIYEFVGSVDSLIAVASYRKSLNYYTKPTLYNNTTGEKKFLRYKDIYHPLIKKPVVNSCEIYKSFLITGSNASGKSTFLKTVAINAILAQTIYTCTAKEYESSYFIIYSSMALRDDIFNRESYYIVEIKSLKRIIDNVNDKIPCLCFVDEILRGTNTIERISASSEVLNYFANNNCICIAATHDVELTHIIEKDFINYHFQENILDDKITFDYKLYSGRAETRNAIKLLKLMGYSNNIVERAEERAEKFLSTGVWSKMN